MPRLVTFSLLLLALGAGASSAADAAPFSYPTPPRLSLVDGEVTFWRPSSPGATPAQVNTPLAAGDTLATGPRGTIEIQVGAHTYLRAGGASQLRIASVAAQNLRVEVDAGVAALDVRALAPGHTIEVASPQAAFFIERAGYYRLGIDARSTSLSVRRGGSAVANYSGQGGFSVESEQELHLSVQGSNLLQARPADAWDGWNLARTDQLEASATARYLAPGVYGAADLDRHGQWQTSAQYGPLWVPWAQPAGWAPYSAGRWIADPVYGLTWIDDAPWGYAPFHHGRWVSLGGAWAWAPGHRHARVEYAPALVGWFPGLSVGAAFGTRWVALGWGEPVAPWWGPRDFHGQPYWGGWGGPRVVNRSVIADTAVLRRTDLANIVYANARHPNAVVASSADRDGRASQGIRRTAPEGARDARRDRSDANIAANPGPAPVPARSVSMTPGAPNRITPTAPASIAIAPEQHVREWQARGGNARAATIVAGEAQAGVTDRLSTWSHSSPGDGHEREATFARRVPNAAAGPGVASAPVETQVPAPAPQAVTVAPPMRIPATAAIVAPATGPAAVQASVQAPVPATTSPRATMPAATQVQAAAPAPSTSPQLAQGRDRVVSFVPAAAVTTSAPPHAPPPRHAERQQVGGPVALSHNVPASRAQAPQSAPAPPAATSQAGNRGQRQRSEPSR